MTPQVRPPWLIVRLRTATENCRALLRRRHFVPDRAAAKNRHGDGLFLFGWRFRLDDACVTGGDFDKFFRLLFCHDFSSHFPLGLVFEFADEPLAVHLFAGFDFGFDPIPVRRFAQICRGLSLRVLRQAIGFMSSRLLSRRDRFALHFQNLRRNPMLIFGCRAAATCAVFQSDRAMSPERLRSGPRGWFTGFDDP